MKPDYPFSFLFLNWTFPFTHVHVCHQNTLSTKDCPPGLFLEMGINYQGNYGCP